MITIGVTGTNGKTSTVEFVRQLVAATGLQGAGASSLGLRHTTGADLPSASDEDDEEEVGVATAMQDLADAGFDVAAVEMVSEALAQDIFDGVELHRAIMHDIAADHIDAHGSHEAYVAAKHRLLDLVQDDGIVAVSRILPVMDDTVARAEDLGLEVRSFGPEQDNRLAPTDAPGWVSPVLDGVPLGQHRTSLPAGFAHHNLLAALTILSDTIDPTDLAAAIPEVRQPAGRMQEVPEVNGARVFIDYAHNPFGLLAALEAARAVAQRRVVVVFGCGGDRDRGKREQMGSVAAEFADIVIVTDDNPRSEDPAAIRRAVLAGAPAAVEIGDRPDAVWTAMEELRPGDVLVVAGRGAETTTERGEDVLRLSDQEIVEAGRMAMTAPEDAP